MMKTVATPTRRMKGAYSLKPLPILSSIRTSAVLVPRAPSNPLEGYNVVEVIAMSRPVFAAALLGAALLFAPLARPQQAATTLPEKFEEMTRAQAESYRKGIDWLV